MIIGRDQDIRPSEITPKAVYVNRRQLMAAGAASSLMALSPRAGLANTL